MQKDENSSAGYFRQPPSAGVPSFVISFRIKYIDNKLCYFHQKEKQRLFNTEAYYSAVKEEYCAKLRAMGLPAVRR
jgi:hypothetical protein